MNFHLSEEQLAIQSLARDFATNEIAPFARTYDEEESFPIDIMQKLYENGLANLAIPEQYGGPGIDKVSHSLIVEEIAKACAGVATSLEANSLSSYPILIGGSDDLKRKYLTRLTEEGKFASFALTEPNAGSDVSSLSTTIKKAGDEYILDGEKCFITNASYADFFVVLAVQKDEDQKKSFTALIVDRDSPGVTIGEKEKKMGLRASDTSSVIFEEVRVPVSNRLGAEGDGFKIFMKALMSARPMVGSQAVGIAQGAYEAALAYAKERKQFGKPITQFQSLQFMLADMAMTIEASRLLVQKAVYLLQEGTPSLTHASFAKCYASDTAMKVATDAVQIFGGYGFIREYPVEKYLRDAKIMQIYEGTNQIQRVVIAKEILS
ncbi:acyl-CoA dehydrogenase family protein [Desertibacillus haloalkaliphilus]|uniref:acyl-CoA dehydrogenase family protein n=1 Tax=Desertibacillus haloalkaliphilus TaxID=1328930 RepID=UPI001C256E7A|nr:acyl-CoA dehydrogenase family protein [Desertibacillus haloalkaliphilus]MBU8908301.1 acyl-CoA dehydrogenase family protein [Desertibacillus haloalkaliphilus]